MRPFLHLFPIGVAYIAFWLLVEPMRVGELSVATGIGSIAFAYLVSYIALVGIICTATGTPLSLWFVLLKQLVGLAGRK
jgi:hypothetical protein